MARGQLTKNATSSTARFCPQIDRKIASVHSQEGWNKTQKREDRGFHMNCSRRNKVKWSSELQIGCLNVLPKAGFKTLKILLLPIFRTVSTSRVLTLYVYTEHRSSVTRSIVHENFAKLSHRRKRRILTSTGNGKLSHSFTPTPMSDKQYITMRLLFERVFHVPAFGVFFFKRST